MARNRAYFRGHSGYFEVASVRTTPRLESIVISSGRRLMEKMTLARFGEDRAIAALAVIVEDEEKDKKRIIHDATHGVKVNNRIKCRDKLRAPGAIGRRSSFSTS